MCLGLPARVLEIDDKGQTALVDVRGSEQSVPLTALTLAGETVVQGDWLLLLTGLAVGRLDERDAQAMLELQAQAREGTA